MNAVRFAEIAREIANNGQSKDYAAAAILCFVANLYTQDNDAALVELTLFAKALSANANGCSEREDLELEALQQMAKEL